MIADPFSSDAVHAIPIVEMLVLVMYGFPGALGTLAAIYFTASDCKLSPTILTATTLKL
jgi:hypothetical protein